MMKPWADDTCAIELFRRSAGLERRIIAAATKALLEEQRADGHFVFELEADATIPAEYILLVHYLGEPANAELEQKIGVYLKRIQGAHGGWPLYHDGAFDISATVKAYFALKMIGDRHGCAAHEKSARGDLARGGAAKANVFTRFLLALFGEIAWSGVPTVPVELILLPRWFPIHLSKMSYWARTVLVPLLVLAALKPRRAIRAACTSMNCSWPAFTPLRAARRIRTAYWAAFFGQASTRF